MVFAMILHYLIQSASASSLTWDDCVNLFSKQNPSLLAESEAVKAAERNAQGSYAPFFPEITASLSRTTQDPKSQIGDPLYASGLNLSYSLFAGLKDRAKINLARANLKIAEAKLQNQKAALSYSLRQAFAQLKYADENLSLTTQIAERRSQNERLVRAQYENGRENEGSALFAKSLAEQAKYDVFVAENSRVLSRQKLAQLLGEDDLNVTISGDPPSSPPPVLDDPAKLYLNTPSHLIQAATVEANSAQTVLARGGFFPSLDLSANFTKQDNALLPNQYPRSNLALTLTIPLFSGLSTLRSLQNAAHLESASLSTQKTIDFQAMSDLRETLFSYKQAVQKLKVDQLTRDASLLRATIARKKYSTGLMTYEQWDIIETELINRQKAALSSKRDLYIAEANFRKAQGQGDLP